MAPVQKSLLLLIDDSEETLKPIDFISRLYPEKGHLNLVLSYLVPPLAPVYRQRPASPAMAEKKKQLLQTRDENTTRILDRARKVLINNDFPADLIHEHIQEKELSVAHHACRLADMKKVDAVVIRKRFSSRLESFLKGDVPSALLYHCLVCPIWFVSGTPDPATAIITLDNGEAALRAVDHAAFMLEETPTHLELVHFTRSISKPVRSDAPTRDDLFRFIGSKNMNVTNLFAEALDIVRNSGISDERISISLQPSKGKLAAEILNYGRSRKAGIVVLGHKGSSGTWSFMKGSVTKKILGDFKDMAVWVTQ